MLLKKLKFFKKWVIVYKGKAIAVGNSPAEAINEACELLRLKVIR